MDKAYLGIDVGSKGFLAVQYKGEWKHYSFVENNIKKLAGILRALKGLHGNNIVCIIEDVHAIFNSSAKSTFEFGMQKGYVVALVEALEIPYHLVAPKEWQKEMWDNKDIVMTSEPYNGNDGKTKLRKKKDTKKTSLNAGERLFPHIDFRRNDRCKNIDDNKVDATLMSEYARRKNL